MGLIHFHCVSGVHLLDHLSLAKSGGGSCCCPLFLVHVMLLLCWLLHCVRHAPSLLASSTVCAMLLLCWLPPLCASYSSVGFLHRVRHTPLLASSTVCVKLLYWLPPLCVSCSFSVGFLHCVRHTPSLLASSTSAFGTLC